MAVDKRKAVLNYYRSMLKVSHKEYDPTMLEKYIDGMSDYDVEMAYQRLAMVGIISIPFFMVGIIKNKPQIAAAVKKMAVAMEAILKCIGHYDYSKTRTEEINGNYFSYEKDFPIEKYRKELYDMGDDEKGEKYTVYLQDGELVVY